MSAIQHARDSSNNSLLLCSTLTISQQRPLHAYMFVPTIVQFAVRDIVSEAQHVEATQKACSSNQNDVHTYSFLLNF